MYYLISLLAYMLGLSGTLRICVFLIWHTQMSYLIFLNPMLSKKIYIAYAGPLKLCVFVFVYGTGIARWCCPVSSQSSIKCSSAQTTLGAEQGPCQPISLRSERPRERERLAHKTCSQLREAITTLFWGGKLSQIWVGGVADSQTGPKAPKIAPKVAFFDPKITFRFPKSHKNHGVGG